MKKIEILVVGKHPDIMKTILRLINNKPEYNGSLAFSADEAVEKFRTISFDVVLLGAGLTEVESAQIRTSATAPVVQHYGGGSGLIYAEILQALAT